MNIELRNIRYFAEGSEETPRYKAKLYVNNIYTADVSNQGHGGPDRVCARQGQLHHLIEAEKWAKEQPPYIIGHMTLDSDLEAMCGDILAKWLSRQDMLRAMQRKVLTWEKVLTTENGFSFKLMEYGFKGVRKVTDTHIKTIKKQIPNAIILNELSTDEAFKIYMEGE